MQKNTAIFLEKHYQNSKNTTNITPCWPPVLSELQGVDPLYPLFSRRPWSYGSYKDIWAELYITSIASI